jgi:integrase
VPHVEIWHSIRSDGDTKTPGSRRILALPELAVKILSEHSVQQQKWRARHDWNSAGIVYVFGARRDTVPTAQVIRTQFRAVVAEAGIAGSWTPRDLRHTFVSIMSDRGARVELIADLVGHKDLATTWIVYRHQLRPVITEGADLMDSAPWPPLRRIPRPRSSPHQLRQALRPSKPVICLNLCTVRPSSNQPN